MAKIQINKGGSKVRINDPGGSRVSINNEMPVSQLSMPGGFGQSATDASSITLQWLSVVNATSYVIDRSPNGSTGWTQVYSGSSLSYTDTGLSASTTYYYRIKATAAGYPDSTYATDSATTTAAAGDNNVDAPVLFRANTSSDGTKVYLLFDRAISDPTGKHTQFSYLLNDVSKSFTAAALYGTKGIQLTCETTITPGDDVCVTYTRGDVQATTTGYLQAFGPLSILNCATTSDIPFFENWDVIVDATDSATMDTSGSNITLIRDKAATSRYFRVQSTGYATLGTNVINVINSATNEYTASREFIKPASGRFTVVFKIKTPPSGDAHAADTMYLIRYASVGAVMISSYNATAARRNMRIFTTGDYYSTITADRSLANDDSYHYIVATYDGTTYKMWCDGTYVAKTVSISTVEIFNRLLQQNTSARAPYGLRFFAIGEYLSDTDVATLNTYLNTK